MIRSSGLDWANTGSGTDWSFSFCMRHHHHYHHRQPVIGCLNFLVVCAIASVIRAVEFCLYLCLFLLLFDIMIIVFIFFLKNCFNQTLLRFLIFYAVFFLRLLNHWCLKICTEKKVFDKQMWCHYNIWPCVYAQCVCVDVEYVHTCASCTDLVF